MPIIPPPTLSPLSPRSIVKPPVVVPVHPLPVVRPPVCAPLLVPDVTGV